MGFRLVYSKRVVKDVKKLEQSNLDSKAKKLLSIISKNPYTNPPPYEKLVGDLSGFYSKRINITHRLVYKVYEKEKIVQVVSMWTHYE